MEEIWKDVSGFESRYEISTLGRLRGKLVINQSGTYAIPHILKGNLYNGYVRVYLCDPPRKKGVAVHRLVAEAFIPNPENKAEVNHKNGIKGDNRLENLEWMTRTENIRHGHRIGIMNTARGEKSSGAKLTEKEVLEIRKRNKAGEGTRTLAKIFGVRRNTIISIKKRETWSHI